MSEATPATSEAAVAAFIDRWSTAHSAERANYVLFLSELSDLLDVPRPDPAGPDTAQNAYVFERAVTFHHRTGQTTTGRIDLYKRGAFVCECKQYALVANEPSALERLLDDSSPRKNKITRGSEAWDRAMIEAHGQAERYARSLPVEEEPPPFLLVVDVGHVFELYADFSQKGKAYLPFPDARTHRIRLADLARPDVRTKLRAIWLDPTSLDPAKISAAVTREVAGHLAALAKSFEAHHDPAVVAGFLSRCLFCMFAEDVELLPKDSFGELLTSIKSDPGAAAPLLHQLFAEMNVGRFSVILRQKIPHFNGGLFADATALPLDGMQLDLLIRASQLSWRHVEPAIFGTLLERALNPAERHKLGAHYTPRAYVERLVLPTVIEPLRAEWEAVRAAALVHAQKGALPKARAEITRFHNHLCEVTVLDPACGSGNFLYVTLEHLKRLEGEVLDVAAGFGENLLLDLATHSVDPHQFLGIELNPRAASLAELVLWIGYLQWHFRTRGDSMPAEPVLKKFRNIECRDAVLAWDGDPQPARDERGEIITVWDRQSMKTDLVTGRDVPDETKRVPLLAYPNARPAEWPKADYIVGNPPYIGVRRLKDSVGDGYVEAIRAAYPDVPETSDYVMHWWDKAARAVGSGQARRFGLITTNSIVQEYCRRLLEHHIGKDGKVRLVFAIADHQWVDAEDGAAVRIAMTVGCGAAEAPASVRVGVSRGETESALVEYREVKRIGTSLDEVSVHESIQVLESNKGMCFQGVVPAGDGFKLDGGELSGLGFYPGSLPPVIRRYIIGRDLVQRFESRYIIDFFGMTEADARRDYPQLYQRLLNRVYPERAENKRASYREKWWIFAEPRPAMRRALVGLSRFIVTPYTATHRPFIFVSPDTMPDAMAYAFPSDDAFVLGVLSSCLHVKWSLAAGGTLEDRPRYTSNGTFFPFPFPACDEAAKARIRALGEELDAHRTRAQAQHPGLSLTAMYNVLEALRAGRALTPKEQAVHDAGLVSVLRQIHDELDRATADAYGWPWPLAANEILERVVALNGARATEEAQGLVRWLRPDYQIPLFGGTKQITLGLEDVASASRRIPGTKASPSSRARKTAWPKTMADRAKAVESALAAAEHPVNAATLAKQFSRAKESEVQEILETLAALGRAHQGDIQGTFVR